MRIAEILDHWPNFLLILIAIGIIPGSIMAIWQLRVFDIARNRLDDLEDVVARTIAAEQANKSLIARCDEQIIAYLKVWRPAELFRGVSSRRSL